MGSGPLDLEFVTVTYAVDVLCDWTVVVIVPSGVGDGDGASVVSSGAGLEMAGGRIDIVVSDTAGVCVRVGSADGASGVVVWLDGVGVITGEGVTTAGVELGVPSVIDPKTVVCPSVDAGLATASPPKTLPASTLFVHSTTTPFVLFIGIAKHSVPAEQTSVMTKLPAELQFPTFPDMQAMSPDVQGEEKLRVEKRLL